VTFEGLPAGTHSLLLYTVQVPLEFFNMDFSVTTYNFDGTEKAVQRRYIRPQNSDEYNPAPNYVLVTSDTPASRSVGNMMRFDGLETDDGRIDIRFFSPGRVQPGGEPIRGPGLNAVQLLINPTVAPTAPVITQNPVSANGIVGGQVTLSVEATGTDLIYQWLRNGQPLPGANGSMLILSDLQTSDAGQYSVAISNPAGRVESRTAVVGVVQTDQITEGLLAYFKFDEADGIEVVNSVAGGVSGEVRGTDQFPGRIDTALGRALMLDGIDQYVFVPSYNKPDKAMTISGWVSHASSGGTWGPIINNYVASGPPIGSRGQFFTSVTLVNDPVLGQVPSLRGSIEVGPNQPISSGLVDGTLDKWHHFAMTANGVSLTVYWDGAMVGELGYLGSINQGTFPWLAIGANLSVSWPDTTPTGAAGFWNVALDDFALWGRSLSDLEIKAIFDGGVDGKSLAQVPPVLFLPPPLSITRSGGGVVVSWPANFTGFTLEGSPSLSPASWTAVPGVVNNSVTIANPTGLRFFRLVKP
jgi:hypothetical protein